jgi:hypothetical protein
MEGRSVSSKICRLLSYYGSLANDPRVYMYNDSRWSSSGGRVTWLLRSIFAKTRDEQGPCACTSMDDESLVVLTCLYCMTPWYTTECYDGRIVPFELMRRSIYYYGDRLPVLFRLLPGAWCPPRKRLFYLFDLSFFLLSQCC